MLSDRIQHQLPRGVCLVTTQDTAKHEVLFAAEEEYISMAVPKRKSEFRLGRWSARKALQFFNVDPCPILAGANREPIWPRGYVGSITHCEGFYAAAVARDTTHHSLGIDAEQNRSIPPEIRDQIMTVMEKKWYNLTLHKDKTDLLIFSAKESIFKCLYPLVNHYIDFLEIDLIIDRSYLQFRADLPDYLISKVGVQTIEGIYNMDETHIFTASFLSKH
jgi:enterobactin synthetase component D